MNEENYKGIKSFPDGVDDIINKVQNDSSVTTALATNKKFFDDFTSLISDLNELVKEKEERSRKLTQISLF